MSQRSVELYFVPKCLIVNPRLYKQTHEKLLWDKYTVTDIWIPNMGMVMEKAQNMGPTAMSNHKDDACDKCCKVADKCKAMKTIGSDMVEAWF